MIINDRLLNPVKIVSSVFISGALGLELWNVLAEGSPFSHWSLVFYLGRLALISHGIEGMVGAFYAPSQGRKPLTTALYIFFVGTVGFVELFQPIFRK
jgi:hypothetical protein